MKSSNNMRKKSLIILIVAAVLLLPNTAVAQQLGSIAGTYNANERVTFTLDEHGNIVQITKLSTYNNPYTYTRIPDAISQDGGQGVFFYSKDNEYFIFTSDGEFRRAEQSSANANDQTYTFSTGVSGMIESGDLSNILSNIPSSVELPTSESVGGTLAILAETDTLTYLSGDTLANAIDSVLFSQDPDSAQNTIQEIFSAAADSGSVDSAVVLVAALGDTGNVDLAADSLHTLMETDSSQATIIMEGIIDADSSLAGEVLDSLTIINPDSATTLVDSLEADAADSVLAEVDVDTFNTIQSQSGEGSWLSFLNPLTWFGGEEEEPEGEPEEPEGEPEEPEGEPEEPEGDDQPPEYSIHQALEGDEYITTITIGDETYTIELVDGNHVFRDMDGNEVQLTNIDGVTEELSQEIETLITESFDDNIVETEPEGEPEESTGPTYPEYFDENNVGTRVSLVLEGRGDKTITGDLTKDADGNLILTTLNGKKYTYNQATGTWTSRWGWAYTVTGMESKPRTPIEIGEFRSSRGTIFPALQITHPEYGEVTLIQVGDVWVDREGILSEKEINKFLDDHDIQDPGKKRKRIKVKNTKEKKEKWGDDALGKSFQFKWSFENLIASLFEPGPGAFAMGEWLASKGWGVTIPLSDLYNKQDWPDELFWAVSGVDTYWCRNKVSSYFLQDYPGHFLGADNFFTGLKHGTGYAPSNFPGVHKGVLFARGKRFEYCCTGDNKPFIGWPKDSVYNNHWHPWFPEFGTDPPEPKGYLYQFDWFVAHPYSQKEVEDMDSAERDVNGLDEDGNLTFSIIVQGPTQAISNGEVQISTVTLPPGEEIRDTSFVDHSKVLFEKICIEFDDYEVNGAKTFPKNCEPLESGIGEITPFEYVTAQEALGEESFVTIGWTNYTVEEETIDCMSSFYGC